MKYRGCWETVQVEMPEDGQNGVKSGCPQIFYTYRMRRRDWALLVAVVMYACGAFAVLFLLVGGWQGSTGEWVLLAIAFSCILVTAIVCWSLVWRLAVQNNAWVRLDDEGIEVSDWQARPKALKWQDVRGMQWRFGAANAPWSAIRVQGPEQMLHIPALELVGRSSAQLVNEIAARAGLRCVDVSRFGGVARYEA